jgi:uncharacterized protein (TIGR03435 family)
MRYSSVGVLVVMALSSSCWVMNAQGPKGVPTDLKFEVATLRPSPPLRPNDGGPFGIRSAPGGVRYQAGQCPLNVMLTVAFHIKTDQIVGGPEWISSDRFDMNAKAEKPSSIDELHMMLINLLVDRFRMKFHMEKKELPVYALSVDKDGSKLPNRHDGPEESGQTWIDVEVKRFPQATWHATFSPMSYFVFRLSQIMDRPVIDLTNLPGTYDFDLNFTRELPPNIPETAMVNGAPIDTSGPTIYEALRKQLGLKLDRQKGPVDIMVIDHIEKLSEN